MIGENVCIFIHFLSKLFEIVLTFSNSANSVCMNVKHM